MERDLELRRAQSIMATRGGCGGGGCHTVTNGNSVVVVREEEEEAAAEVAATLETTPGNSSGNGSEIRILEVETVKGNGCSETVI